MTTATTRRVSGLRTEAAQHGDVACRILCDLALDGQDSRYDEDCLDEQGHPDYSGGGHGAHDLGEIRRVLRLSQADAIAECEAILREADARAAEVLS
jgi:hypothetical protein